MGRDAGGHNKLTALDLVVKETIRTLESAQKQLFVLADNARSECSRLADALEDLDGQLSVVDDDLCGAESLAGDAQARVAAVSGNFEKHTEEEIKAVYEEAKELQVKVTMLRERRDQLIRKKRELETGLLNLRETAEKAENMVSQTGVVIDFIRGNLKDINVKLETIQQRQQLGLQIIRAQEEERKRVAREIHDGPAQSLANVVLRMEFCEKLMDVDPDKVRGELKELKEIVKNNLKDVRKIIFDLRPMALDDLGVLPALKRYIEDFREKNDINIEMNFAGKETRLEPALEIALFRLVQEALNNVVKHARASRVNVTVEMKPDWVTVTVADDGVGFVPEEVLADRSESRFGLISMKERTDLLEGQMEIDTGPGRGTRLMFRIPVAG